MTTTIDRKRGTTEAMLAGESTRILREMISEGDVVYSIIRHVSSSGMSRDISFFIIQNGKLVNITWHMCRALRTKVSERSGSWVMKRMGVGMDMAFDTVYSLGIQLFNDGYALKSEII